ncbi:MAG: hypothetical protein ACYCPW_03800 [Nitrososphaerales archaeon]
MELQDNFDIKDRIAKDKRVKEVMAESVRLIHSTPDDRPLSFVEWNMHVLQAGIQIGVTQAVMKGVRRPVTKKTDIKELRYAKESNYDLEWKILRVMDTPQNNRRRSHSYCAIREEIGFAKDDYRFRKSLNWLIEQRLATKNKTFRKGKTHLADLWLTPKGTYCLQIRKEIKSLKECISKWDSEHTTM